MRRPASHDVPKHVTAAVEHILAGDLRSAREALSLIDKPALVRERTELKKSVREWLRQASGMGRQSPSLPRKDPRPSVKRAQYAADSYTCRYAHCQKPVVDSEVLALLATQFPRILGSETEFWPRDDEHIVFWTCTASYEHRVSRPYGGGNDVDNVITACSACQYAKREYPLIDSLWEVTEPSTTGWDGLVGHVPRLRTVLGIATPGQLPGHAVDGAPKAQSLIRVKGDTCSYRVERVEGDRVELRMMWRYMGRWKLEKSGKPPRWRVLSDISWEEVSEHAPEPGSQIR